MEAVPDAVRESASKAQTRLCQRYRRMVVRDKLKQVVVTAIARELAGFVWAIACITSGSLPRAGQTGCADNAWLTTQASRLSGMHGGGREPVRGNPRQSLWNLDFRVKTEAGPRRTMVLR